MEGTTSKEDRHINAFDETNAGKWLLRLVQLMFVLLFAVAGSLAYGQSTCVQPPSGAIAWWSLDETSGNTAADRVGGHTGSYANGPVPAPGEVRGALRFNGTNYVVVQDSDDWAFGANNFTIELWVNFDTAPGGSIGEPSDVFIGNDEGPGNRNKWFFAVGGGYLYFHINSPTLGPMFFPLVPFSPTVSQWYHLAVVRRGSTYTVFIDGVPSGLATNTNVIPNPNAPLTIAEAENLGFVKGRLDEVTIYNRALAPEEIMAIFNAGTAGKCISMTIQPSVGGDTGNVSVQIIGVGFEQGATVKLVQSGQPDIVGSPVTVAGDGTSVNTTFALNGQPRGLWDVVVTNPDQTLQTLLQGFTIQAGTDLQPWVDLVGLPVIRLEFAQNYWVAVGNSGNTNIPTAEVFLDGSANVTLVATNDGDPITVPQNSQMHASIVDLAPGQVAYLPLLLTATDSNPVRIRTGVSTTLDQIIHARSRSGPLIELGLQGLGVIEPKDPQTYERTYPPHVSNCKDAPAGYLCTWYIMAGPYTVGTQQGMSMGNGTVRWSIGLFYPDGTTTTDYDDIATLYPQLEDMGADRPYYGYGLDQSGDVVPLDQMIASALAASQSLVDPEIPFKDPSEYPEDPSGISCFDFYYNAYNFLMDEVYLNGWFYEDFTDTFKQGLYNNDTIRSEFWRRNIPDTHTNTHYEITTVNLPDGYFSIVRLIQVIFSFDPNNKVGSQGVGTAQFLSGQQPLRYSVLFENLPTASAPVQEAVITDQLDASKMDLTTLSLGAISFGTHQVVPPPDVSTFAGQVDLRPATDLLVDISGSLNPNTGLLTWRLTSIDPATGNPPTDPRVGFLPPDVNPPEGDGSVLFTVMPKQSLPTNTQIQNQATIIFDENPPMNTPTWLNTLDNTPPTSQVSALPGTELCSNFTVQWSGNDVGAGIANYAIYVSDNGGSFTAWQTNTTSTSAVFNGQVGHSYGFYSIATDLVRNVESGKSSAEATTQVNKGTICEPIGPPTVQRGRH
jgi:hypothetical protein